MMGRIQLKRKSDTLRPPAAPRLGDEGLEPRVWLNEDGIVCIDCGSLHRITLATMEDAYRQHVALSDEKRPVLFLGTKVLSVELDAFRFPSSDAVVRITSAAGIVTDSFMGRHLAQFFVWYHKPVFPVRVFASAEQALAWLKGCPRPGK